MSNQEYYTPRDNTSISNVLPQTPELLQTLSKYNVQMKNIRSMLYQTVQHNEAHPDDVDVNNGISFLQLRTQALAQYNLNLLQYLLLRGDNRQIKNHPVVHRLAHLRLVLEMTKPISTQLQGQINQILTKSGPSHGEATTTTTTTKQPKAQQTPLLHQDAFFVDPTEGQKTSSKKESYEEKRAAYAVGNELEIPTDLPTPAAPLRGGKKRKMEFLDEVDNMMVKNTWADDHTNNLLAKENMEKKKSKMRDAIREKAQNSVLVRQLREELSERPMEESTSGLGVEHLQDRQTKEITRYEEENFTRLRENAKDRKRQRHNESFSGMSDMGDIADFSSLYRNVNRKNKK